MFGLFFSCASAPSPTVRYACGTIQVNDFSAIARCRINLTERKKVFGNCAALFFKLSFSGFKRVFPEFKFSRRNFIYKFFVRRSELPYQKNSVIFINSYNSYSAWVRNNLPFCFFSV